MRRLFTSLLLVCVAAGCQEPNPTAPIPGPVFAKGGKPNCEVDPSHPKCKDGGNGEDAYTATDLGTVGGKKSWSAAGDISDPTGGTVVISGVSAAGAKADERAVRWQVNESGDVDGPHLLPVVGGYSTTFARGISDDGLIIVGYADDQPVRWDGPGWGMIELVPYDGYGGGLAFDVNIGGVAVGWSTSGSQIPIRVATLWDGLAPASRLHNPIHPDGVSRARGINNDGIVAGEAWDAGESTSYAVVWRLDGTWCVLGPGSAHGLTDVSAGTILVAGEVDAALAKVWEVDVGACAVVEWDMGASQVAFDVRATMAGWEAVGMRADAPMVWTFDGAEVTATQLADDLKARRINQAGEIVGRSKVKGAWHGILWQPAQP
jgi:hypothetical protein